MLTPAIYRTAISHTTRAPVHHEFEYRSYSWYVDVDELPRLPWWLRPFARLDAQDHFTGGRQDSLRARVRACLAEHAKPVPDGPITALLQARVLGRVVNPVSIFWCHDRDGVLRHVIAEVHNTYGQRHAYVLPPADTPVLVTKAISVSPSNAVDGHYLVLAPRPGHAVDIMVSLHRESQPAFAATLRGTRHAATTRHIAWMQVAAPLTPLIIALRIRAAGIRLWLRRVPVARPTEKHTGVRPGFGEYHSRTAFHSAPAPIGTKVTTLARERIGYRSMTGPPRVSSDLDALLRRVARRDTDAFAAFYDRTRTRVYGVVTRVLRDTGYSEETTQDIYLEVWRTAKMYDSAKGSALAWLMTMAHRRAVDRVRAEQAAGQRESRYGAATAERSGDVVAESAIAGDERRRVIECLQGLTDTQRQCIEMAYYGGLTYVEVSQRLSANLSTIKSRMRDGLRRLRDCLDVS